jgi:hypothetical protein
MANVIIPAEHQSAPQSGANGASRILTPEGVPAIVPSREISLEDAKLLREYKKFLMRMGLREALYCQHCWSGDRHDGCEAHVTDNDILIKCRCQIRFHRGSTY